MKLTNLIALCAMLGGLMQAVAQPEDAHGNTGRRARSATVILQKQGSSYLGVGAIDIDADRAKALKLPDVRGVEIKSLDGDGPAGKAGLKEGDVVLEYNGQRVEGTEQFVRLVRETPPGRQVRLTISRDGKKDTVTVTTGARTSHFIGSNDGFRFEVPMPPMPPEAPEAPMPPMPPDMGRWWHGRAPDLPSGNMSWRSGALGIETESLGPQLAQFFGVKEGVLVRSVNPNSPSQKGGIKAGDVIVKIAATSVASPRDISSALRSMRGKDSVSVTLVRNQKEMTITLALDRPSGSRRNIARMAARC